MQAFGLERVHEPYIKHIEGRIWALRLLGRDGIARALHAATGRRAAILCVLTKKTQKTPRREIELARKRAEEVMSNMIPVEESFAAWRKDPNYVEAYSALEDEFSLAATMIQARTHANLTQKQRAKRMYTTQAVIAAWKAAG